MPLFRRANTPKSDRRKLDSGGWVDLAEWEKLWEYQGPETWSVRGEAVWRSPKGTLVMKWAKRHQVYLRAGIGVRNVLEWGFDVVDEQDVIELLLRRQTEGFPHGEAAARHLFPDRFPPEWDPGRKVE